MDRWHLHRMDLRPRLVRHPLVPTCRMDRCRYQTDWHQPPGLPLHHLC